MRITQSFESNMAAASHLGKHVTYDPHRESLQRNGAQRLMGASYLSACNVKSSSRPNSWKQMRKVEQTED